MVDEDHRKLSIRRQCDLLWLNRSSYYYSAKAVSQEDVLLMNEIREIWERRCFYGYRRVTRELCGLGFRVNRKRVQRLMQLMGIQAIYPKPNTSAKNTSHAVYPYLLDTLAIARPNQAWMVDITYLKLNGGFMYLVALIDIHSRYVVGWSLSNTLHTDFCLEALSKACRYGAPEIINSDQGCQFTSDAWVDALNERCIKISMTGKGRCLDNIYIERFWRSLKYEEIYLNDYRCVRDLKQAVSNYIEFYNHKRWHQSLDYKTPAEVYFSTKEQPVDLWTNPLDRQEPFGTCGQTDGQIKDLPTACGTLSRLSTTDPQAQQQLF